MAVRISNSSSFWALFFVVSFSLSLTCCSLSTVSISETSHQTLVCALLQGSFLRCSSFPRGSIRLPMNRSFSGVVSGNEFVCVLRSPIGSNTSSIFCWRFSGNGRNSSYKRIYHGPELKEFEAENSRICGIERVSKRLRCWQPVTPPSETSRNYSAIAMGENFLCGLSPPLGRITCEGQGIGNPPNDEHYISIAAGFRRACGITFENDVRCWGQIDGLVPPAGKFSALALGENRSCGLRLTNGTVICWGTDNFRMPRTLENTHFISIVAKRRIFCGVTAENYSLYCWGNQSFKSGIFAPFDKLESMILPGPCRKECPCGPLPGSESLCSNRYIICQVSGSNCQISISPTRSSEKHIWKGKDIAFLVIGCVGSVSIAIVVGFFLAKYYKYSCGYRIHDSGRLDQDTTENQPKLEKRLSQLASLGNTCQLEEFSLDELARATNGFCIQSRIGLGSFGSVYHGVLLDGRDVAIKRAEITNPSSYGIAKRNRDNNNDKDTAFVNELESLSRLNHKNLVRLLGFYEDAEERVLVYEYMENHTLSDHLHNPRFAPLTWQTRVKIALDAARGILYLHEYAEPQVIHRDIKSSNILIDASWTGRISDFGLSQIGPTGDGALHLSLHAAGTLGYIDPEYYRLQQLTTKSDVYSFGVVLLEILSGLKAIHLNDDGNPKNIVDVVLPHVVHDGIHRILDGKIPPPTPYEMKAVVTVGNLAADCILPSGRERPSMAEVVSILDKTLDALLVVPSPEPNYLSRTESPSSSSSQDG